MFGNSRQDTKQRANYEDVFGILGRRILLNENAATLSRSAQHDCEWMARRTFLLKQPSCARFGDANYAEFCKIL